MSAKDMIHETVKNALVKDGWTITADPYTIQYGDDRLYADLAAERTLAAERKGQKIIVEIKSFVGQSDIQSFKVALGQYMLYLPLLAEVAPDYTLYLAVSSLAYNDALQRESIKVALAYNQVRLIVVQLKIEEIVQWIH